jgi:hypothetical protein
MLRAGKVIHHSLEFFKCLFIPCLFIPQRRVLTEGTACAGLPAEWDLLS